MSGDIHLTLFAVARSSKPVPGLERRLKEFLGSSPMTESLDGPAFAETFGSAEKADYLLGNRALIAELKTLNGDPKERIERQLKERLARPNAPIAFGQVGINQLVDVMDDSQAIYKAMVDLSSRAVRRHLQKANEQIGSTRARLDLPNAAGLMILINESEAMIDAACIGYAIRACIDAVEGGYSEITYVWGIIESHRIRLPDGSEGYPMLMVTRGHPLPTNEANYLGFMLTEWAASNGGILVQIPHGGDWAAMTPIYEGGPPILSPY